MDKDQFKGSAEQAKGFAKEAAGKLVGNDRLRAEGKADQAAGKAQAELGDIKSDIKKAVDKK